MFSFVSLLMLSNTAVAVPIQVNQQGRLLDTDGEGLSGDHQLIFQLFDEETSGDIQWAESMTVEFNNGYYSTLLGTDEASNPLDDSIFANYPLYLELKVNGEALSPRHQLTSVPYAQIAGVAESVDGGTVSASEVIVGGQTVIDSAGNWVGTGMTDTLSSLSCALGEIAGWNGSAWTCVSDNTLTYTDIENYLLNNPIDLNIDTTIGGSTVVSNAADSDTLAALSCANDGEIARYDLVLGEWYCDADYDTDTVLDQAGVLAYVNGSQVDLGAGSQVGGANILTTATTLQPDWNDIQSRPPGLDDGDDDTQLGQSDVVNYVQGQNINLGSGSQVGGAGIVTTPNGCNDGEVLLFNAQSGGWSCGVDTDTTLTPTEVQTMVEVMSLNLQNLPQVNGDDVLTTGSVIAPSQIDANGSTNGQVLVSDGTGVSWGAMSGGGSGIYSTGLVQLNAFDSHIVPVSNYKSLLQTTIIQNGILSYALPNSTYDYAVFGIGNQGMSFTYDTSLPGGVYEVEYFVVPVGINLTVTGNDPLVILATNEISVQGNILLDGQVGTSNIGGQAGPGGISGTQGSIHWNRYNGINSAGYHGGGNDSWTSYFNVDTSTIIGGSGGTGNYVKYGHQSSQLVGGGGGGGAIALVAAEVDIGGTISANGGGCTSNGGYNSGGGGGGSIWLRTTSLTISGDLLVDGGCGAGAGNIRIDYEQEYETSFLYFSGITSDLPPAFHFYFDNNEVVFKNNTSQTLEIDMLYK